MGERNYKVYIHEFPNGKVYVGITCQNVDNRWKNGLGYKGQTLMWNAIQKYGWDNIIHDIYAIDLTKEQAETIEIELIDYYNSTDQNFGYNVDNGGNSIGKHSEQTKNKIGQANKGKVRTEEQRKLLSLAHLNSPHLKGKNNPFYGKKHTKESREKIRQANLNRDKNTFHHRTVLQINKLTNEIIQEFNSIREAEKATGIHNSSITACCKGRLNTTGGFKWMYLEEYEGRVA